MSNVTVKIVGGKDKENLTAIVVRDKRWGENGSQWGTSQHVQSGDDIPIESYYSGKRSSVGKFDLEEGNVVFEITADGPGNTGVHRHDGN